MRSPDSQSALSGLAIASLVLAVLSLLLGPLGSVPAIVCGHLARARSNRRDNLRSREVALSGLIVAYVLLTIWGFIFVAWYSLQPAPTPREEISFNEFLDAVRAGKVAAVTIRPQDIDGRFREPADGSTDERDFTTLTPQDPELLIDSLREAGVEMRFEEAKESPLVTALYTWAPLVLILALPVAILGIVLAAVVVLLVSRRSQPPRDPPDKEK